MKKRTDLIKGKRIDSTFQVCIVMTDGRSFDNVRSPALLLRGRNIKTYAVGIGRRFNRGQLLQIAAGRRSHVLTAGFRQLQSIAGTIGRRACRGTATTSKQLITFSFRLIALKDTPLLRSPWDFVRSHVFVLLLYLYFYS